MRVRPPSRKLVFVTAFVLGAASTAAVSAFAQSTGAVYPPLKIFAKVLAYVENDYVEPVDESKLVYSAIKGMLAPLDPHTVFLPPNEYQAMKDDTSGEFGGLGLEIAEKAGHIFVLSPVDDTPASRAGIRPGDEIVAVDGKLVQGESAAEVSARLKGPPGTQVTLTLMRRGFSAPRDFPLVRAQVRLVSVSGRLVGGVAVVRIKSFQDGTADDLGHLLEDLHAKRQRFRGLVLDLRNNPGGLLEEGVKVADRFLATGVIVTTKGRGGRNPEVEYAHVEGTEPDYPLVVLINGGTASASEVVAGALHDHHRATLFGSTSFGKGSVQLVIDLDDGSGLKLTTARYYTPSGRSIQDNGIAPDVRVQGSGSAPVMREKDLTGAMPNDAPGKAARPVALRAVLPRLENAKGDRPLLAALAAMREWGRFQAKLARARALEADPTGVRRAASAAGASSGAASVP